MIPAYVLRDDDDGAALAPQPTVGEIPALLARLADAGLDVDLQVEGTERQVPNKGQPRPGNYCPGLLNLRLASDRGGFVAIRRSLPELETGGSRLRLRPSCQVPSSL